MLFFYCCSSAVVSIFTPPQALPPIPILHPRSYPFWLCPRVLNTWMNLPLFSPIIPLPLPLYLLSVCSSVNIFVILKGQALKASAVQIGDIIIEILSRPLTDHSALILILNPNNFGLSNLSTLQSHRVCGRFSLRTLSAYS